MPFALGCEQGPCPPGLLLEKKLLPFINAQKEPARLLESLANETKLTIKEANEVDFRNKSKHLASAIKVWNARKSKDTPLFKNLTPAQQTVIFSITFHQGNGMPDKEISQKFYTAALKNNWKNAEKYLRNYNVKQQWYKNRVAKEANLLRGEFK